LHLQAQRVEMRLKTTRQLDAIDRRLLQIAQDEFPLTLRPWLSIADRLGITEEEVLGRLSRLCGAGIVRKVGPALDARRVGLRASTLVAMKVPSNKIRKVAELVGKYEEVSHCYEREHEYNLWFTVAARNEVELEKMLEEIRCGTDIAEDDVLDLRPTRIFKINVRFQLVPSLYT
jgi:DNA-binding Lrp family transcriptional regulator